MKKLMIAAAAAAMVSGAFAEVKIATNCAYNTEWDFGYTSNTLYKAEMINFVTNALGEATNVDNIVTLDKLQIVTYKTKSSSDKVFCLNNEKNATEKFFKPSAKSTLKNQAVDGAIYYNGKAWTQIEWGKDKDDIDVVATNGVANKIYCFADKGGKKVWGAFDLEAYGAIPTYKRDDGVIQYATNGLPVELNYNAVAEVYAEIDVEAKQAKSLKSLGDTKYSLKTYKDEAARDKAIEKLEKKFEKAGGKF